MWALINSLVLIPRQTKNKENILFILFIYLFIVIFKKSMIAYNVLI